MADNFVSSYLEMLESMCNFDNCDTACTQCSCVWTLINPVDRNSFGDFEVCNRINWKRLWKILNIDIVVCRMKIAGSNFLFLVGGRCEGANLTLSAKNNRWIYVFRFIFLFGHPPWGK